MKYIKLRKNFIFENINEGKFNFEFIKTNGGKNILLFRGQYGKFYEKSKQGYSDAYGMLFVSSDINNAYFYTKPKQQMIREILVFEVPNNIMQISGKYIDRARDEVKKAKEEGYAGIASNIGELDADEGEVGLFNFYKPIAKYQTKNGAFSKKDLQELKQYGLSQFNQAIETELSK